MHEQSLVAELLEAIDRLRCDHPRLRDLPAAAGVEIEVLVGQLSGVEPLLLQSAFEMQAPARLGPHCRLTIQHVDTRAVCEICQHEFSPASWNFFCPSCGSGETRVVAGEGLVLHRLVWSHEPQWTR